MSKHCIIRLSGKSFDTYLIYKMVWSALPYNTKAILPADAFAVYRSGNSYHTLPSDGILNPKKMGLFAGNEIDPNEYTLYLISKSSAEGFWGGRFMYDDPATGGVSEPISVRISFRYAVESPRRFLECGDFSYIRTHSETRAEDIAATIREKLNENDILSSKICDALHEKGISDMQKDMSALSTEIENGLNEKIFIGTGLHISGLTIEAEESDLHIKIRNNLKWHEYISESSDKHNIG